MTQETNIWLMDNSWMRGWFMDDSWVFPEGKPATKTYINRWGWVPPSQPFKGSEALPPWGNKPPWASPKISFDNPLRWDHGDIPWMSYGNIYGWLVVFWKNPVLKNDGVRQLGWWKQPNIHGKMPKMATKPPTRWEYLLGIHRSGWGKPSSQTTTLASWMQWWNSHWEWSHGNLQDAATPPSCKLVKTT